MEKLNNMDDRNIPFDELPPLIGPIKKSNKINFNKLGFSDIDELNIEHFEEFYIDYDGFYALLELNNFNFGEFLEEIQHNQITLLAKYFQEKKELEKSIKLLSRKFDWMIEIYTSEELYEKCAEMLTDKNNFLAEIENINKKHNTKYGSK